jgi:GR25 family glycosyltransferase involved in LPS biosynthesis
MIVREIFDFVDSIFVINLKKDLSRKIHVESEFQKFNIKKFKIVNAVSFNDAIVKEQYKNNGVLLYPPCFRCNTSIEEEKYCMHENNFLTPKQVANFLSFKKIMEGVVESKINTALIFEDDFKFKKFIKKSNRHLRKFISKNKLFEIQDPLLVRIGSHTRVNKKYYLKFYLFNNSTFLENNLENMANPCFLINNKFAKHFLDNFTKITTTSDNFIHRKLCEINSVVNYSLYPFPINQLSYGNKKNIFKSTISEDFNSSSSFENTQKVENEQEYKRLLSKWLS